MIGLLARGRGAKMQYAPDVEGVYRSRVIYHPLLRGPTMNSLGGSRRSREWMTPMTTEARTLSELWMAGQSEPSPFWCGRLPRDQTQDPH